jgi:hypothetical protein
MQMKWLLCICLILFSLAARSQDSLHVARLKSLQGKTESFSTFAKKDSLFLICFWSVNSDESVTELNSINANLEKWQNLAHFRFMAVCVDEGNTLHRMRPMYNMNGWTFDSYADIYGDLRRALHSENLPQSMIVYKGEIVYEQNGWTQGSDSYLIQRLMSVKK